MKQILFLIAIAAVVSVAVVAFTSKSTNDKISTIEMAQFKAWQESNENADIAKAAATKPVAKRTVNYQSPKAISTSQNEAKTTEKKGWSKAAKGTVIGAVSGAAAGAVINKRNRAVGAVIGGIIGGGAGYGIGRSMDKKDGRS